MTKVKKIKKILILGGGSSGWMTAAALSKTFKNTDYQIQLIESDQIGIVGVGEATIPPVQIFNQLIGLDENEFIKATQATFKLGIKFVNWDKIGREYHHAFGDTGKDFGGLRFYQYWLKMQALNKANKYEDYSLNALASEEKRFMRSIDAGNSPLSNIAYAFQEAVVDTLLIKCRRALKQTGLKRIVMAGGVAANKKLRESFAIASQKDKFEIFYPSFEYCTDNGAMIAYAGCQRLLVGETTEMGSKSLPRWSLESLSAV